MKNIVMAALASAAVMAAASPASAQSLRGVRADASVVGDRFYSEGRHDNEIGYAFGAGVDFNLSDTVVLGAEGTFLNSRARNDGRDGAGFATRKSYWEYGAALRAGMMVDEATLVYAKGGYVLNQQRKRFIPDSRVGGYDNLDRASGWVAGLGAERMLGSNLYAKAEARYANYDNNSSRLSGLLGLGVLFGPSRAPAYVEPVAAPAPMPAPMPVAPQTQTCADGSVVLATDVCPQYVPPTPPPPATSPERG